MKHRKSFPKVDIGAIGLRGGDLRSSGRLLPLSSALVLWAALLLPIASSAAPQKKAAVPPAKLQQVRAKACHPMPASTKVPWETGERLSFELDVMGASAGSLALMALPPVGTGTSKEYVLRALAASNSFFSKVRRVRGRSTAFVRAGDLHPRRYEEHTDEGGVSKAATVIFQRPDEGRRIVVDWSRDQKKGSQRHRYANEAFDPVSAAYYLRAIDLKEGQELCFDSYGIRKLWRVKGKVVGKEEVRVPAGTFQAWHLEGVAIRTDDPRSAREIHIWISADERRLPVAALGVIDLGAVRAQLTHIGEGVAPSDESILSELERPLPRAPAPAPSTRRPRPR